MPSTDPTLQTDWPEPITPVKRRRLQTCFEHGRANVASGNFDYAVEMFSNSLAGDPGNLLYAQSLLQTLYKKYGNNKKAGALSGIRAAAARRSWKKARGSKDWDALVRASLELLKLNPWDTQVLISMASVCEQARADECQLYFLKTALDTNPKDPEVNRLAALALTRIGQFDQAIVCWHRVEQVLPNDPQAPKEIAELTVQRQLPRDRQQKPTSQATGQSTSRGPVKQEEAAGDEQAEAELSVKDRLKREITDRPDEVSNYIELSEIYLYEDRFDEAEKLIRKAIEITGGGDLKLRERYEDYQIRRRRRQFEIADERARTSGLEEAKTLAKRMKAELNRVELEIFAARCQRSPGNDVLQFELGLRLKKAGKFSEAIQSLQQARGNVKRKAAVHLELGECFQYIKQYKLAMANYDQAIQHSTDKDAEIRKLALYRAGVLAMGLKELDVADRRLTELAGVDFGYKDVAERLDKLAQLRHSR